MKTLIPILLAVIAITCEAKAQFVFGSWRPAPTVCFQPTRPAVCWGVNRWSSPSWGWNNGWNNFGWGASGVFITYESPRAVTSSGFGTLKVPETRIHRVPPPIQLTEPIVIHEGASFRWRR